MFYISPTLLRDEEFNKAIIYNDEKTARQIVENYLNKINPSTGKTRKETYPGLTNRMSSGLDGIFPRNKKD
ncbi:MAG: hypothetical protein AB7G80_04810 [Dongiaceae bacterium]